MDYTYTATKVDPKTWMVNRYRQSERMPSLQLRDEALMCDMPEGVSEEAVVKAAIARGSWA